MTTYTEEGCPFKDDCGDPEHNHPPASLSDELREILDDAMAGSDFRIDDATQALQALIKAEVIKELTMAMNDPRKPYLQLRIKFLKESEL
jgi:uncharacterized protein with von Willebrand factor type A (vWA) domain